MSNQSVLKNANFDLFSGLISGVFYQALLPFNTICTVHISLDRDQHQASNTA